MTRTRIHTAVGLSLLAHALLVAIPVAKRPGEIGPLTAPFPFVARLVEAPSAKAEPAPEPVPAPKLPVEKPRAVAPPKVAAIAPPEPRPVERPQPAEVAPKPEPQFDMLAMINARRERRRANEETMLRKQEARDGSPQGASADPALASLNRNLQTLNSGHEGTGGVFTILSKGTRTAEFSFNGFRPDTQRRWREVIEVDAGQGGNVELAIVRRMIELIRSHYTGDFTWRSQRLDRSVVMSARPEDGPGLEEFLLREFFGTPTLAHQR